MKRYLLTAIALTLCFASTLAKDKEVVVVRGITIEQRDLLPKKPEEFKTRQLEFSDKCDRNFCDALTRIIERVLEDEYEHYVFAMSLSDFDASGNCSVRFHSCDALSQDETWQAMVVGDLQVQAAHFLIVADESSFNRLNTMFKRTKQKIKFVREYEYVNEVMTPTVTSFEGSWHDGSLTWSELVINNVTIPDPTAQPADSPAIQQSIEPFDQPATIQF